MGEHTYDDARSVKFPADTIERLTPYALKRKCHPHELARRIVETVVDEKLIDAVLDDKEE